MMRVILSGSICGLLLFGATTSVEAQTTWNYFVSNAGSGNSLVTWNVSGSLATAPGAVLMSFPSSLDMSVNAPGIYVDSFIPAATPQPLPTLDGSHFELMPGGIFVSLDGYSVNNSPGAINDRFGLRAPLLPRWGPGMQFLYHAGTQSALIPIEFSSFNAGSYQSKSSMFDTELIVNLTVETVPEPSTLGFAVWTIFGLLLGGPRSAGQLERTPDS